MESFQTVIKDKRIDRKKEGREGEKAGGETGEGREREKPKPFIRPTVGDKRLHNLEVGNYILLDGHTEDSKPGRQALK